MTVDYDIVVPTAGRPELARLLDALAAQRGPALGRVIVIHDGDGRGPAAARNRGWRAATAEWVAFLDDDVVPDPDWSERLAEDLAGLGDDVAASQGRIHVPLPADRRPTDRERCVAGLEDAVWATADMAYRRGALARVGGFDERFPRAYREDSDLGLRVAGAGYRIVRGRRRVVHPVAGSGPWASVRLQSGNADDVLMRALHGRRWRERAGAPPGRRRRHVATAASGAVAAAAAVGGRRRTAAVAAAGWALGTGELAWARIAPGPRTPREVGAMLATSALLPAAATFHLLRGVLALPSKLARPAPAVDAVLFDRDGTLVADVPYNGDPAAVRPMPGAVEALQRLRVAGVGTAVVSNQSGIGRGLLTEERVAAVNRRVEELLGPVGPWLVCPHAPEDGCDCRKPAPGLVLRAAELLGADPARCAVVGDIGSDVEAARAAGARSILVPTAATRREEVEAAPEVAADLGDAVDRLLGRAAA